MSTDPSAGDPLAALEALRATGSARADPVRAAVIAALARRAAALQGPARGLLQQRVDRLAAEPGLSGSLPAAVAATTGKADAPAAMAALTALVDRLGRAPTASGPADASPRAGNPEPGRAASTLPHQVSAAPPPLNAVTAFKSTWSRLRAEQRLRQALDQVPANAGPLNSSHVVHRSLRALHGLSPVYLDALMAHVDTLLWLDQAGGAGAPPPRPSARSRQRR